MAIACHEPHPKGSPAKPLSKAASANKSGLLTCIDHEPSWCRGLMQLHCQHKRIHVGA